MILFELEGFQNFSPKKLHGHLVFQSIFTSKWILTYNIIKVNISISKKKSIITLCTIVVAFGLLAIFPWDLLILMKTSFRSRLSFKLFLFWRFFSKALGCKVSKKIFYKIFGHWIKHVVHTPWLPSPTIPTSQIIIARNNQVEVIKRRNLVVCNMFTFLSHLSCYIEVLCIDCKKSQRLGTQCGK